MSKTVHPFYRLTLETLIALREAENGLSRTQAIDIQTWAACAHIIADRGTMRGMTIPSHEYLEDLKQKILDFVDEQVQMYIERN